MNGEGCMCAAHSESECCCDVDWRTASEVAGEEAIERVRAMVDRLKAITKEAEDELSRWDSV